MEFRLFEEQTGGRKVSYILQVGGRQPAPDTAFCRGYDQLPPGTLAPANFCHIHASGGGNPFEPPSERLATELRTGLPNPSPNSPLPPGPSGNVPLKVPVYGLRLGKVFKFIQQTGSLPIELSNAASWMECHVIMDLTSPSKSI